jgi:nucleoside-diphosphate-sugar epimerase
MTRVLLFGGSGFIGGQVCRELRQQPRVTALTTPGRAQCDLVQDDMDQVRSFLRRIRPDVVINCTGRLTGTGYDLVRANAGATAKLLDAVAAELPGARFVRLGSAAEYGPVQVGTAIGEDDPARPVSEYGATHLAGTQLLQVASEAGRVDGVALRVFNPVGPGLPEDNLLGRVITLIRAAGRSGEGHISVGSLAAHRDFVDVRDAAAAVVAAALTPDLTARVFNVASGRTVTARYAVGMMAEVAGFTGEIREEAAAPARSAAVDWMLADISRAAEQLGWKPRYELADSINAAWHG